MGKVTKTEIFLLVLTLLFAALSAALFFTGRPQSEGYTVTAQRGDDSPRQPESCPLNINTATVGQLETRSQPRHDAGADDASRHRRGAGTAHRGLPQCQRPLCLRG